MFGHQSPVTITIGSHLKSTVKEQLSCTSRQVHVVLKTWKFSEWRCLQNEDGVENTLGTTGYIGILFVFHEELFCLKASSSSLPCCWSIERVAVTWAPLQVFCLTVNWFCMTVLGNCMGTKLHGLITLLIFGSQFNPCTWRQTAVLEINFKVPMFDRANNEWKY